MLSGFDAAVSGRAFVAEMGLMPGEASDVVAFFLFFLLLPDAFFKECVRPCSLSFCNRSSSLSLSACSVGSMGMTLSGL